VKKRIWHLCSNRWNSAITEYALSTVRALAAEGNHCVFTPLADSPADLRARQHANAFQLRPIRAFGPRQLPQVARAAAEIAPDVVVTYGGPETTFIGLIRANPPFHRVRFRGQELLPGPFIHQRHLWAHRQTDLIVTPSAALTGALLPHSKCPVVTIQLGCDSTKYRRVTPQTAVGSDRIGILVLGRFDLVKGHREALALFSELKRLWPTEQRRLQLHFIGEPANLTTANLEDLVIASGLRLGDDVIITDRRIGDIADNLSRAGIGLIPSTGSEIICRVAEEFLLCGTPVAVSGVGSLSEVLFDGAGCSFASQTMKDTVNLLLDWTLRSSAELESAKVQRAERAKERFSLAAMGRAWNDLLTRQAVMPRPQSGRTGI